MIKNIKYFFKERFTAKPFDLMNEEICKNGKNNGYWITYMGVIKFGNPWGFWVTSCANSKSWGTSRRRQELIKSFKNIAKP